MGRNEWDFLLFPLLLSLTLICGSKAQCFSEKSPGRENESFHFEQDGITKQLEFTLDMFHKLYRKDEKTNLFFSPHSIHQALTLAFFGSSGNTEKQLRKTLRLDKMSKNDLIKLYKMESYFHETTRKSNNAFKLDIANKIYFSQEEPIHSCVKEIFDKELETLNFNETETSRNQINKWVENNTNGKIKEIIPAGYINPNTRLALVNSAYFKGSWTQQFKKSNTKLSLFYVSPTEVTQTMMMNQKGSFRHGISEDLRSYIIELPYEGTLSMFILLPPFVPNALEETISRLNAVTLREAMEGLYENSIEVSLPRFKVDQTFELNEALKSIGIHDLFDPSLADLSDFSNKTGLSIGTARHESFIEVNEEGSEAAAATILIDTRSGRPLEQTRFVCNHPFVFYIFDNVTNKIIFIGAFKSPKLEKH